jgi:hypothetical protein
VVLPFLGSTASLKIKSQKDYRRDAEGAEKCGMRCARRLPVMLASDTLLNNRF